MKRLVLLLLLALPMLAQVSDQSVVQVTVDPTGACGAGVALRYNRVLNKMWGCVGGVWTLVVGGGGGGGTVNSCGNTGDSPYYSAATTLSCPATAGVGYQYNSTTNALTIRSGVDGTGEGQNVLISSASGTGTNLDGGNVNVFPGACTAGGSGVGGDINLTPGPCATGTPGTMSITAPGASSNALVLRNSVSSPVCTVGPDGALTGRCANDITSQTGSPSFNEKIYIGHWPAPVLVSATPAGPGLLSAGVYRWCISGENSGFQTLSPYQFGLTSCSAPITATVTNPAVNGQFDLAWTNSVGGANYRKTPVYRTAANGSTFYLVASPTADLTAYTDNTADASLDLTRAAPTSDTSYVIRVDDPTAPDGTSPFMYIDLGAGGDADINWGPSTAHGVFAFNDNGIFVSETNPAVAFSSIGVRTDGIIIGGLDGGGALIVEATSHPTVSGCTSAALVANSTMLAGQVNGTPTGACALTLTFPTAPHGWNCAISNMTTANMIRQTATTQTTAVFTGVTVANDVLSYGPCVGW